MGVLRVGLTGGLGSGKSSVARVWAEEGVPVLEADAMGRALTAAGEPVYARIVEAFGGGVVLPSGELDRAALARLAFEGGRVGELNRIVHPAVIAMQERQLQALAASGECTLAVVESALIFEASGEEGAVPGWRERFDRIVLVAAPEAVRVERFALRSGGGGEERLREDARRRMAAQLPDAFKRAHAHYVIENDRTLVLLRREALRVLEALRREAGTTPGA